MVMVYTKSGRIYLCDFVHEPTLDEVKNKLTHWRA